MNEAYAFGRDALRAGVLECNSWNTRATGGDHELLRVVQGAVRASEALGMRKLDHINRIPFLCGRLREPGVKQLCLDQYAEAPFSDHDSISNDLFDPLGEWWTHIEDISEDGNIPSSAFGREVDSIADTCMDDALAEALTQL